MQFWAFFQCMKKKKLQLLTQIMMKIGDAQKRAQKWFQTILSHKNLSQSIESQKKIFS